MWILVISIIAALFVALIATKLSSPDATNTKTAREAPPADCCGAHEVCEKKTLIQHDYGEIIYYNDEELDAFRGKAPDQYSREEEQQIREVLLTMRPGEVSGWLHSLMARHIKLPLNVREEALTIVKKQRA
jgi:hypothetical protein